MLWDKVTYQLHQNSNKDMEDIDKKFQCQI